MTPVTSTRRPATEGRGGRVDGLSAGLAACLVAALVLAVATAAAQINLRTLVGRQSAGRVMSIADGDTVDVRLDQGASIVVRLAGIDAPERGEPFADDARDALRVMLLDQRVTLRGTDVDRFGRLVAHVVVGGADASVALVTRGLACHFTRFSSDAALARAETAARRQGAGFWAAGARAPACAAGNAATVNGPFHGNAQSHLFHAPGCVNYNCRNCRVVFSTAAEAVRAGYRPAADCLGTRR